MKLTNKLAYIPLLIFVAPSFMAAKAPYRPTTAYNALEVSEFEYLSDDEYNVPYKMTILNTGDKYFDLNSLHASKDEKDYLYFYSSLIGDAQITVGDAVLPPQRSATITGTADIRLEPSKLVFAGMAFIDIEEVTYKEIKNTGTKNGYYYDYSFAAINPNFDDEFYAYCFVEYTIGDLTIGKRISSFVSFNISSRKEMDVESIKFQKLMISKGESRYERKTDSNWLTIWIALGILLGVSLIASIIALPIILVKTRQ